MNKTTIAIERTRLKLTQSALSKMIGKSVNYICLLESGKFIPSAKIAFDIAKIFGKKIDDFEEFNYE